MDGSFQGFVFLVVPDCSLLSHIGRDGLYYFVAACLAGLHALGYSFLVLGVHDVVVPFLPNFSVTSERQLCMSAD